MEHLPSRMAISESLLNVMERPVGNSPGPETTRNVTSGQLLSSLPEASTMVAIS